MLDLDGFDSFNLFVWRHNDHGHDYNDHHTTMTTTYTTTTMTTPNWMSIRSAFWFGFGVTTTATTTTTPAATTATSESHPHPSLPDFRIPIAGFYKGDVAGHKKGISLQECADFCLSKKNPLPSFQYHAKRKVCGLKKVHVFVARAGAAAPAIFLACSRRVCPLHVV